MLGPSSRRLWVVFGLVMLGIPAAARARQDQEVLGFFRASVREARAWRPPPNIVFRFEESLYPQLDDAALAALDESTRRFPDHPERATVAREKRRREKGPDRVEHAFWYAGPQRWRYSTTDHGQKLYVDQVVTDELMWSMTADTLAVIDPKQVPPQRDLRSAEGEFYGHLGWFVWGRLHNGESIGLEPVEAGTTDGKRWYGLSSAPGSSSFRWEGDLGDLSSRAMPLRSELVASETFPREVGTVYELSGWAMDPLLKQPVAHRIELRAPGGRLLRVAELRALEPLDQAEFRRLTAEPSDNGSDPVRGPVTYASVLDFRPSRQSIASRGARDQAKPMPSSMVGATSADKYRPTAWIAAGALVSTLVAARVWRARSLARARKELR